jgi:hypothetical protein
MILYFYKEKAEEGGLQPAPVLFRVTEDHYGGITYEGHDLAFVYEF